MESLPLFFRRAVNFVFQVLAALSSAENKDIFQNRQKCKHRQSKICWSLQLLKMVYKTETVRQYNTSTQKNSAVQLQELLN